MGLAFIAADIGAMVHIDYNAAGLCALTVIKNACDSLCGKVRWYAVSV
jgi:hypothetical protein